MGKLCKLYIFQLFVFAGYVISYRTLVIRQCINLYQNIYLLPTALRYEHGGIAQIKI